MTSNLQQEASSLLKKLLQGTWLGDWDITVKVGEVEPDAAAKINVEWEQRIARIVLDPNWEARSICTLEDLLLHEVGHIPISEIFDALGGVTGKDTALALEELAADRVGKLLKPAAPD